MQARISKQVVCAITSNKKHDMHTEDVMHKSIERIPLYEKLNTYKVDVSTIAPEQAAELIIRNCKCQWQSKNADLWQLNFVGFWLWKCHKKTGLLNIFFKECINNLLLLFHEFFTFLQTVTFSLDINDCTVMKYPIQNSRSNSNVCKHFIPLRKGLI